MKLRKVYDEVKTDVKRRILDDVLFLFPLTFLTVCMTIISCENIMVGEAVSAVMSGIMAFLSIMIWIIILNKMIRYVADKIEHLLCVAEVDNTYKDIDIKSLKANREFLENKVLELSRKAGYKESMTLDEILEEVNGDTKECECELDEGDTMS